MSGKKYQPSKLIGAIRNASLSGVIEALDTGCEIEEADMHGQRGLPLRTACFVGNLAVIRELIARGADINAAGGDGPCAPLRLALRCRHHGVVALLIKHGANIPEGVTISQEILSKIDSLEVPPILFEAPRLPEAAPSPAPASSAGVILQPASDNFTLDIPLTAPLQENALPLQPQASQKNHDDSLEIDIDLDFKPAASVGEATRVMSMDLMRFDEDPEAEAPPSRPSFAAEAAISTPPAMTAKEEHGNSLDFDLDFKPAASFGTETRMVSLDLMRFNENPEEAHPPLRQAQESQTAVPNDDKGNDSNTLDFDLDFKPGANFGTETRMVSLDLMRFNENPEETAPPTRSGTQAEARSKEHPGDIEFEPLNWEKSEHKA